MSEADSTSAELVNSRPASLGLRHLALFVADRHFEATVAFYRDGLGMAVDWQPDADNVYLSGGPDNLALHRAVGRAVDPTNSPLDHLGFAMSSAQLVRDWFAYLKPRAQELKIELLAEPRLHRDGATSCYLSDPAGHKVQLLHVPSLKP